MSIDIYYNCSRVLPQRMLRYTIPQIVHTSLVLVLVPVNIDMSCTCELCTEAMRLVPCMHAFVNIGM